MFKNFASAIALLAIGAYASNEEKPIAAGEFHSQTPYKYGRFVASMKASHAMGTGSAFYLQNHEDFDHDEDVFDNWNAMLVAPSMQAHMGATLFTKLSAEYLGDKDSEWQPTDKFTLDDEYHRFEIEWTPDYIQYKIDDDVVRRLDDVEGLDKDQHLGMTLLYIKSDEAGMGRDDSNIPYYTDFDYVEVWNYDLTNDSFNLNFRDDFDYLDTTKWSSVDSVTWEEQDSIFKEENAYIKDGRLHLKLDRNADFYNNDEPHHDDHHDDVHHGDFHVLPAPQDGTLDAAIEKATRVGVSMVRQYLDSFSESMARSYGMN